MKIINKWFIIVSVLGSLSACEERIALDVEQVPDVYVIDGLVTNRLTRQYVRIKKGVDFYDPDPAPDVDYAHVTVKDDDGNVYAYLWSTFQETYLSEVPFRGVEGRVYTLEVRVDEKVFTAVDSMRSISGITEVTWSVDEEEKQNPQKEGYFYQALLTTTEPQETKDYYLFKIYRNDTIQRFDDHTGVFVTDDIAIGEKIENFPAPVYFALDDWGKFEVYSLTPEAFKYYFDLSQILNNDGGMFSGIPANPVSNIKGEGGLGFFQVSGVAADSVKIGDPDKAIKF